MGCDRAIIALFVTCHVFCSLHAFDTITRTHFISDSENASIVSSDGNFKLGFFSPGKSQARYVGIWFNKISEYTVVWVANRETPVKNSDGIFRIGGDGNLAVFCGNRRSPVWSTNVSVSTGTSSIAKLLDSGNLVLVAEERIIWQSFDYPTDTVVPGMRFGLNRKTGLSHVLTSWNSIDDPSPGEFSGRLDPDGIPQFFLYKSSGPYWRGGPWNGRNLNGVPDVATRLKGREDDYTKQIDLVNYTVVNNENESYFAISSKNENSTLLTILVLEPMGTVKRLIWDDNHKWAKFWMAPQDLCDEYDRCGANEICNDENAVHCSCLPGFQPSYSQDLYLKCSETRKINGCGKGDGEGFVRMEAVKLPDARNSTLYGNMNLKECERECLESCSCTGYAILDVIGSARRCITWYGELRDMRHYQDGQDFYLRVDAVELAIDARKKSKHFLAVKSTLTFIVVPLVVEMLLVAMCFYYLWTRQVKRKGQKQKKQFRQSLFFDWERSLSNHEDSPDRNDHSGDTELTLFKLSTLIVATNNFSLANKLGGGGFGPVYKGQLLTGQDIAVKRLSTNSRQGILEFKNEVLLIVKLQHRNLVRLLGYRIEKDEKMLIYEFMSNQSLDYFIFDRSRKLLLDWTTRFDIILGIARGILYLHQDSRLRIIHRDLKVSNILLDGEMKPKISDFGTARIVGEDQTQENTKRVIGTCGYMSPEYALDGLFSMKSDVFSFGVILLEIISGKKNKGFFHDDHPYSNLIQYTWELWSDGKALEVVDSCINDLCPSNEVMRCIQVGLLCVQDNARDRPSMSTVVSMLSNETLLPSPDKSTFATRRNEPKSSTSRTEHSNNGVTFTIFDGR